MTAKKNNPHLSWSSVTKLSSLHQQQQQQQKLQLQKRTQKQPATRPKQSIAAQEVHGGLNMQGKTKVAIIGGGIAGLSCARHLSIPGSGFDVTVYDTGRLRVGGRCSSRQPGDRTKEGEVPSLLSKYRYDHAAQILSVVQGKTPEKFIHQVQEWEKDGILKRFPPNSIYQIIGGTTTSAKLNSPNSASKSNSTFGQRNKSATKCYIQPLSQTQSSTFYYGSNGMGSIAESMVDNNSFQLKRDVWVSPSNGVRYLLPTSSSAIDAVTDNMNLKNCWKIQAKGKVLGTYDTIIIAHNGKCADRLMSTTPAVDVHSKLRVNFAPTVPAGGGSRMTLNSIYSLTFAVNAPSILSTRLPPSFVFGYISNSQTLQSLTCQTRKYAPSPTPNDISTKDSNSIEVWTILSSPQFAKKYKAPQEFIPPETTEAVSNMLLVALEEILDNVQNMAATAGSTEISNSVRPSKVQTIKSTSTPNASGKEFSSRCSTNQNIAVALTSEVEIQSRKSRIQVLDQRLQLWGAGIPLNVWCTTNDPIISNNNNISINNNSIVSSKNTSSNAPIRPKNPSNRYQSAGFIFDGQHQAGVCGDWLVEPSIGGAWTSGQLLAEHLIKTKENQKASIQGMQSKNRIDNCNSHGLVGAFQKSEDVAKAGIGALPFQ